MNEWARMQQNVKKNSVGIDIPWPLIVDLSWRNSPQFLEKGQFQVIFENNSRNIYEYLKFAELRSSFFQMRSISQDSIAITLLYLL